jgi:hypothetical protein
MSERTDRVDLDDWDGAIGPASADDPAFFEFDLSEEDTVLLQGPGPGMLRSYGRERFETLVAEGEWVPADEYPAREVYETPDGERPF